MKTLFKNGKVVDVFSEKLLDANVLIEDDIIVGVGDYEDEDADKIVDVKGKFISPGFIDGHIHIESTMLKVDEFAKICLKHGTVASVIDPHEIANVCGTEGINYMLRSCEDIPMNIYVMLPSCVPATKFDESFESISAEKLAPFFAHKKVLGLAEMMNYVGAIYNDRAVIKKINMAKAYEKLIDGHAPLLLGRNLDSYIKLDINSDHECSTLEEAKERISKGQWVMIRQGTAARNLDALVDLFDGPESNRCLLVTDDKEPWDLIENGHIDSIIRQAVGHKKNAIRGIKMASINAASCFGLKKIGAIAPSYKANILILNDLDSVDVNDVYIDGKKIVSNKECVNFSSQHIDQELIDEVKNTMHVKPLNPGFLHINPKTNKVRVIDVIKKNLITNELIEELNFDENNGISTKKDILKLAVIERHKYTGHYGVAYIHGLGLKEGAIASTVSHDSHNIIIVGTNDSDMEAAYNRIQEIGGGNVIIKDGKVVDELSLPIAGLMSELSVEELAIKCKEVRSKVYSMGVDKEIAPFMNMAFVSLPVIPHLKLTTRGLVDVDKFELVDLFVD